MGESPHALAQDAASASTAHLPLALRNAVPLWNVPTGAPVRPSATATATASRTAPRPATPTVMPPVEETQRLFDPARVLDVRITMMAADWEALRYQSRTLRDVFGGEECHSAPPVHPFTYYPATLTVDGARVENVGVRKKGFLGSVNATQPALKVKLTEYDSAQRLHGMRRMTLNSPVADASYLRQCITYALFARAGVPAPRCSYARVRVNGRDLGLYVHVESIKKPFLRRHFADDEGNLYEGARSDFTPEWALTFEAKTNERGERSHGHRGLGGRATAVGRNALRCPRAAGRPGSLLSVLGDGGPRRALGRVREQPQQLLRLPGPRERPFPVHPVGHGRRAARQRPAPCRRPRGAALGERAGDACAPTLSPSRRPPPLHTTDARAPGFGLERGVAVGRNRSPGLLA